MTHYLPKVSALVDARAVSSMEEERPPLFDERNRSFWQLVRRLLIWLLRELDKWYGWKTFEK